MSNSRHCRHRAARAPLALALWACLAAAGLPAQGAPSATAPTMHGRDVSAEHWNASFTLTDMNGRQRTLGDFAGKVVLLSFGYTHCPDVCPTTLAKFAQVRRLLGADGQRVQGLFVTVDPERDTLELLRRFVPAFDPTFVGLRGTEAQTDAAARAFHANYEITDFRGSILVDHTAATYVVDSRGQVRVVTPYDQSAGDLAQDVAAVLRSGE